MCCLCYVWTLNCNDWFSGPKAQYCHSYSVFNELTIYVIFNDWFSGLEVVILNLIWLIKLCFKIVLEAHELIFFKEFATD